MIDTEKTNITLDDFFEGDEKIRKTTDKNVPNFPENATGGNVPAVDREKEKPIIDSNSQSQGGGIGASSSTPQFTTRDPNANTGNWRRKTSVDMPEYKPDEQKELTPTEDRYKKFMEMIESGTPFADAMKGMKPAYDKDKEKRLKNRMKYQTIGDAFKLIAEGIGASKGANTEKRKDNPYTIKAYNDLDKMRDKYADDVERYKMLDLNNKIRDIQNNSTNKKWAAGNAVQEERFDKTQKNANDRLNKTIKNSREMNKANKEFASSESLKQRGLTFDLTQQRRQDAWNKFYMGQGGHSSDKRLEVVGSDKKLTKIPQGAYWDIVTKIKNDKDLSKKIDVLGLAMGDENAKNALNILVADYWKKYYTSKDGVLTPNPETYDIDQNVVDKIMTNTNADTAKKQSAVRGYLKSVGMPNEDVTKIVNQLFE